MNPLLRGKKAIALSFVILAASAAAWAKLSIETKNVEIGGAQGASVFLKMLHGELTVKGGAKDLMDAEFRFGHEAWKPDVGYEVVEGHGRLEVRQEAVKGHVAYRENEWDIKLNNGLPIDLKVDLNAGKSRLILEGLDLKTLDLDSDAGDNIIDMAGRYPSLQTVHFKTDAGDVDVKMEGDYPQLTSLRGRVNGGSLAVLASGNFGSAVDVDLDGAAGALKLEMKGTYDGGGNIDLKSTTGSINADLSGDWKKVVTGNLNTRAGKITLTLPRDVGVRLEAKSKVGTVNVDGLKYEGGAYVNEAYGKSPITIRLKANVFTGVVEATVK